MQQDAKYNILNNFIFNKITLLSECRIVLDAYAFNSHHVITLATLQQEATLLPAPLPVVTYLN
jgi:hypothetical protein